MKRLRLSRHMLLVSLAAGVVFFVGAGIYITHRPQPATVRSRISAHSAVTQETAVETPVPVSYQWQGAPDDPKYVRLPSISVEGYIQRVNITAAQQIAAPGNVHMAGWYSGSKKPGQPGLSIMDGHVDGLSQPGIFKRLDKLAAGDIFTVETGGGAILRYRVIGVATIALSDALNQLFSQDSHTASQLNIITCGGDFNTKTHQYEKRIIVSAALL